MKHQTVPLQRFSKLVRQNIFDGNILIPRLCLDTIIFLRAQNSDSNKVFRVLWGKLFYDGKVVILPLCLETRELHESQNSSPKKVFSNCETKTFRRLKIVIPPLCLVTRNTHETQNGSPTKSYDTVGQKVLRPESLDTSFLPRYSEISIGNTKMVPLQIFLIAARQTIFRLETGDTRL